MATTTEGDFNLSSFNLTGASIPPVTDAYGNTWVIVNPVGSDAISYGSALQKEPVALSTYYDDTALRGDSYVAFPLIEDLVVNAFFDATPVDYNIIKLKWSAGILLSETYGETPEPTELIIRWDTIGEPQTMENGKLVTSITAGNYISEMEHSGVPEGTWIYYSLFVKYSSTTYREWYERVASVHVQTPYRYESGEMLWKRIPMHYRIQDGYDGPLYRLLQLFGWDIDRIRTLTHHQMVTRDPMLATTEALDALSSELGLGMSSVDLGTARLRNYLNDIGYLRSKKGTLEGVRETLTAITGSDVVIRPTTSNLLSTAQSKFNGTLTVTNNDSTLPTGNNWVFYTTSASAGLTAASTASGVHLQSSAGSGYNWVVAKALVPSVNQASWYDTFYDITGQTNASVIGVQFSSTPISSASVSIDAVTGNFSGFSKFFYNKSNGVDDWYQAPTKMGMVGNGTFTQQNMYFYILMMFQGTSDLYLNNVNIFSDDRYPYEINVYSQKVNLCRDPQFNYGASSTSYWSYSATSGSVAYAYDTRELQFSSGTGASVSLRTDTPDGLTTKYIPFRLDIPYFFSISDTYDSVRSISIVSETYGVLDTQTDTFSEIVLSGNNKRKTWRLERNYEAPWLPINIEDCYLKIDFVVPASGRCAVNRPLLQPLNAANTYFDGDVTNGGWLAGTTVSSGVSDYRWGDDGRHVSFSYYTSDYQRTVLTVYRLIDTIIPVTQTDDPSSYLRFDRIYGYTGEGRP